MLTFTVTLYYCSYRPAPPRHPLSEDFQDCQEPSCSSIGTQTKRKGMWITDKEQKELFFVAGKASAERVGAQFVEKMEALEAQTAAKAATALVAKSEHELAEAAAAATIEGQKQRLEAALRGKGRTSSNSEGSERKDQPIGRWGIGKRGKPRNLAKQQQVGVGQPALGRIWSLLWVRPHGPDPLHMSSTSNHASATFTDVLFTKCFLH